MFNPLHPEDIEEKIQLNLNDGLDLNSLRDTLEEELHSTERSILVSEIQAQNLKEQLAYIDKRIAGRVDPALIDKVIKLMAEKEQLLTKAKETK